MCSRHVIWRDIGGGLLIGRSSSHREIEAGFEPAWKYLSHVSLEMIPPVIVLLQTIHSIVKHKVAEAVIKMMEYNIHGCHARFDPKLLLNLEVCLA